MQALLAIVAPDEPSGEIYFEFMDILYDLYSTFVHRLDSVHGQNLT